MEHISLLGAYGGCIYGGGREGYMEVPLLSLLVEEEHAPSGGGVSYRLWDILLGVPYVYGTYVGIRTTGGGGGGI